MNNKRIWFRERNFGWGWTPATWQGWLVTIFFVLYEILLATFIGKSFDSRSGITSFLFLTFLGIVLLLIICFKYGVTPHWRWGKRK